VHDHAARGGAALPRGAERRPDDPVDREVEVGVVHNDDRVLAAQLQVDALELVGGVLEHLDAGLARAGQRDHRYVRVAHERVADRATAAVDDVDDALGDARLGEQLDEALTQERRVGGRLEDDRVPGHERRRDLPGRDRDREVPGRDHADDADRHAHAHVELVPELRRRRLAVEAPPLPGHVVAHVDRFLDVAARLGEHLAHLAGHQLGQVLLGLRDEVREAEEDLAAPGGRDEPPLLEGGLGSGDGALDVLGPGLGEDADRVPVRRAGRLEGLAGSGLDPLAADVVLEGLGAEKPHRRRS
jgi:hypothetical protein